MHWLLGGLSFSKGKEVFWGVYFFKTSTAVWAYIRLQARDLHCVLREEVTRPGLILSLQSTACFLRNPAAPICAVLLSG